MHNFVGDLICIQIRLDTYGILFVCRLHRPHTNLQLPREVHGQVHSELPVDILQWQKKNITYLKSLFHV
jgi:hypothetical protein